MDHITKALSNISDPPIPARGMPISYYRSHLPELEELEVSDAVIEKDRLILSEYMRQSTICNQCKGYPLCGKEGDMQGFSHILERYGDRLTLSVTRCTPYLESSLQEKVTRYEAVSGSLVQDNAFRFDNFPQQQRAKYPTLYDYAKTFADSFSVGDMTKGVYLFGPPGVGKTHLMLAVLNRLKERGIPCLIFRSDSVFDKLRHIIADNGDLEPVLEAYATVPVLGIDEFAQERANDFTLEKLFRIVNHRFHAQLPTWFTSNYAPPSIYKKQGEDLADLASPLRSRVMQMAKLARVDGDDHRQRGLESLT